MNLKPLITVMAACALFAPGAMAKGQSSGRAKSAHVAGKSKTVRSLKAKAPKAPKAKRTRKNAVPPIDDIGNML